MEIKIYSKDNCPYCQKAKIWFESRGITFQEIKLGRDISREELLEVLPPEVKTVPQIYIDGNRIGGYTDLIESDFAKQYAN